MISRSITEQIHCPFRNVNPATCRVSFSRRSLNQRHCSRYCLSDEHDNCPLYLAAALRSSRC